MCTVPEQVMEKRLSHSKCFLTLFHLCLMTEAMYCILALTTHSLLLTLGSTEWASLRWLRARLEGSVQPGRLRVVENKHVGVVSLKCVAELLCSISLAAWGPFSRKTQLNERTGSSPTLTLLLSSSYWPAHRSSKVFTMTSFYLCAHTHPVILTNIQITYKNIYLLTHRHISIQKHTYSYTETQKE